MTKASRIRILQVEHCPLVDALIDDLKSCLTAADVDEPVEVVVGDYPSPTLLIDGIDVATGQPLTGRPRCRWDLPSRSQIQAAVAHMTG